ncbi:MAG: murein biosynthesis integral membrane protein MurJ [Ardenticatenaceae bacterium]|nr:murein biosynthesis integral membrane protein MurJ [Ardenticatenaceae bacterium]
MSESEVETRTETAVPHRRLVMQAAGLVSVAFLLSRIIGLGREVVAKYYLGLGLPALAFDAAQRLPESIFLIVAGGAIGSAFIPTFSAYFERNDEKGGWRLFSAVTNLALLVTTAVALITFIFARSFILFFLKEIIAGDPQLLDMTVRLMRIMLLSPIIFTVGGVVMGALQARQHFLLPALAPSIYNLGIIAGAVLWPANLGDGKAMGMAVGTVVGAFGYLLVQLPALKKKQAAYSPILTLRDPGVRQVLKLMAPRVLGLSFSEINKFATLFFSGLLSVVSYPALTLAWKIMIMPQGIFGQAMGTAAFPTLASLAARRAFAEMRQILADSLRMLLFLGLPATVLLMTVGEPTIHILFQRGVFVAEDTTLVTWALLFYAAGLVALIALEVVNRAFYALNDTLTPVLAGGVQIALMTGLGYWLSQFVFPQRGWLPLGGVALGHSLSNWLEVGLLLWLLRRKMGGLGGGWDGVARMVLAALLMAAATWLTMAQMMRWQWGALWQLVVASAIGGLVYLAASYGLRIKEIGWAWQLVQRLLRRRRE